MSNTLERKSIWSRYDKKTGKIHVKEILLLSTNWCWWVERSFKSKRELNGNQTSFKELIKEMMVSDLKQIR